MGHLCNRKSHKTLGGQGAADGEELFEERLEAGERERVGSVAFGGGGIVVDFHEDAVDAGGYGGAAEQGDELRLASGLGALAGKLDGVSGVKNDRGELAHDGQRTHVNDEIVIAEAGSALGERDAGIAAVLDFGDGVAHVLGRSELSLLDVDGASGAGGGDEQVGLAAEKSGDLQDVDDFSGGGGLVGFVDIGEDGDLDLVAHAGEDAQAFGEAGAAEAGDGGAVGLVIAGFENERDAERAADGGDGGGHEKGVLLTLDDTGTGDEKQLGTADGDVLDEEWHGGIIRFRGEGQGNGKVNDPTSANYGRYGAPATTPHQRGESGTGMESSKRIERGAAERRGREGAGSMRLCNLGQQGLKVTALGLGCMGMSEFYGLRDDEESTATIHLALDRGVRLLDTADMYGPHTNEVLVGKAVKSWAGGRREDVTIATKFGFVRTGTGPLDRRIDGSAKYVKQACEGSLQRLGVEAIDLYYQHRVDPDTPIEETVGAMAELVKEGKVRYLGLSEAAPETIRRAHKVHPITAVQTEYSLWTRDPEDGVLETCRALGIGFVAYSPLGRGFLTGQIQRWEDIPDDDYRKHQPRFMGENFAKNLELVKKLEELAARKGCTASQLAIAWVMAQGPDIVPIPGTKRRKYLEQNLGALEVRLSAAELQEMEEIAPKGVAAGTRYPESMMSGVSR